MKKQIIYTNEDNEDFTIEPYTWDGTQNVRIHIINGNDELYFSTQKEVHEFCEILMNEAEIAFSETK